MRFFTIPASMFAIILASASPTFGQTTHPNTSTSMGTTAHSQTSSGSTHPQEFKSQAEAKAACGGQQVVWANTSSHVLHPATSKYYGKTKRGAFMCEKTATQAGYHMAKNGE